MIVANKLCFNPFARATSDGLIYRIVSVSELYLYRWACAGFGFGRVNMNKSSPDSS